jgi:hypothetical protein
VAIDLNLDESKAEVAADDKVAKAAAPFVAAFAAAFTASDLSVKTVDLFVSHRHARGGLKRVSVGEMQSLHQKGRTVLGSGTASPKNDVVDDKPG